MYSSIRIAGYRGLKSFRLTDLGRVNLLVGANNSGKTSILECIELLRSAGSPNVLHAVLSRRGEWGFLPSEERRVALAVRHLFTDHDLAGRVVISSVGGAASTDGWADEVAISVEEADAESQAELPGLFEEETPFHLRVQGSSVSGDFKAQMTPDGLVDSRRFRGQTIGDELVSFVSAGGMGVGEVVRAFDGVVLTDKEEYVARALRVIEPGIERIASVGYDRGPPVYRGGRGGIFLKLQDLADRIPIGTLGEGMWRMLGLALALANAKDGVLLVDEIDTGLHYSVMDDMWRMVSERAEALSVQVFATTHSRDCYQSFAVVATPGSQQSGDVTIQRVDASREEAVRFGGDEVIAAAERNLEVR